MNTKLSKLFLFSQKIDRQHVQVAFTLLALVLFVLGAGAPDDGGFGLREALILLTALAAGMLMGVLSARWQKRSWGLPALHSPWLVIVAFLPQFLAFYLPATRTNLPDSLAAVGLIISQILLLVFCWINRQVIGIRWLALGTALNLFVIATNGGFMPISPQNASRLVPVEIMQSIPVGSRFGYKDILLLPAQTHLVWLSDVLLPPGWFPYQFAFSPGDVCIALGAFWLTATGRKPPKMI